MRAACSLSSTSCCFVLRFRNSVLSLLRVHVDHHPIVAVHLGASRIRRTATPAVCTALWPLRRSCAWRCSPSSLLPPLRVAASLQPPRWTRTLLGALRGDRLRQDD